MVDQDGGRDPGIRSPILCADFGVKKPETHPLLERASPD